MKLDEFSQLLALLVQAKSSKEESAVELSDGELTRVGGGADMGVNYYS